MQDNSAQAILGMLRQLQTEQNNQWDVLRDVLRRQDDILREMSLQPFPPPAPVSPHADLPSEPQGTIDQEHGWGGWEHVHGMQQGSTESGWSWVLHAVGCCMRPMQRVPSKTWPAQCVNLGRLDAFASFMVLVQCVVTGFAINQGIYGRPSLPVRCLQHSCLSLYILEAAIRFYAWGRAEGVGQLSKRLDFYFDMTLISCGVAHLWVLGPILERMGTDAPGWLMLVARLLSCVMILRTLRLLNTAQTCNLMVWKLMHAVKASVPTVVSAAALIVLALFFSACIAVELFTKTPRFAADETTKEVVDKFFPSLPVAMMSLLRLVTLDGATELYEKLVRKEPWTAIFFLLVFLSLAISLLNIVTADLVDKSLRLSNNAIASANQRMKRTKYSHIARALFENMTLEGGSEITARQIEHRWDEISTRCSISDEITSSEFSKYFVGVACQSEGVSEEAFEKAVLAVGMSESPMLTKITHIMEALDKKLDNMRLSLPSSGSAVSSMTGSSYAGGIRPPSSPNPGRRVMDSWSADATAERVRQSCRPLSASASTSASWGATAAAAVQRCSGEAVGRPVLLPIEALSATAQHWAAGASSVQLGSMSQWPIGSAQQQTGESSVQIGPMSQWPIGSAPAGQPAYGSGEASAATGSMPLWADGPTRTAQQLGGRVHGHAGTMSISTIDCTILGASTAEVVHERSEPLTIGSGMPGDAAEEGPYGSSWRSSLMSPSTTRGSTGPAVAAEHRPYGSSDRSSHFGPASPSTGSVEEPTLGAPARSVIPHRGAARMEPMSL